MYTLESHQKWAKSDEDLTIKWGNWIGWGLGFPWGHLKDDKIFLIYWRLPWWLRGSSICLQYGRPRFDSWIGKIPWRMKWQHTPVFAWRIPWTDEPGRLQSQGLQRVGRLSDFTFTFYGFSMESFILGNSCRDIGWLTSAEGNNLN